MLGKHRITDIFGEPLVKPVRAVAALVFRRLPDQFVKDAGPQTLVHEIVDVVPDDAITVLLHARPDPALEPVDVDEEFLREFLDPGSKLLSDDQLEVFLQCVLRANALVARRLVNKGDDAGFGQCTK